MARNSPEALRASEARERRIDEAIKGLVNRDKQLEVKTKEVDGRVHRNNLEWAAQSREWEKEKTQLTRQISALQKELNGTRQESRDEDAKLERENEELRVENADLIQNNKQLRNEILDLRRENRQSAKAVRDLGDEVRGLEKDLDAADDKIHQLQEANDSAACRLQEANDKGTRQLHALQASMEQQMIAADLDSQKQNAQITQLTNQLEKKTREWIACNKAEDELLGELGVEITELEARLDAEQKLRQYEKTQQKSWLLAKDQAINEFRASSAKHHAEQQKRRTELLKYEKLVRHELSERNRLLLGIWKRIGTLCGSDWQHQNNLINNHLPTEEVVSNMLPDFSRKLMAAVETVGLTINEQRGENRLLKSQLARTPRTGLSDVCEGNEVRLTYRVRELERRLKTEREARLLDRAGARERLLQTEREVDSLKGQLLAQKMERR